MSESRSPLMSPILMIVGLGNPGSEYSQTRHNVGAWFVENLAKAHGVSLQTEKKFKGRYARFSICNQQVLLLIPDTFMNRSGEAISALTSYFKIAPQNILIAHDELDLPVGVCKLKLGGGHAGHNGLRNTFEHIQNQDFFRLRIGIGRPKGNGADYVLSRPSREEEDKIQASLHLIEDMLPDLVEGQIERVMQKIHSQKIDETPK